MRHRKRSSKLESATRSTVSNALVLAVLCLLASLAVFTYERSLVPLYASQPTRYLLNKVVLAVIVGAVVRPTTRLSVDGRFMLAGALLSVAPATAYLIAARTARWKDPLWGPAVTHLLVIAPIIYAFMDVARAFEFKSFQRTEMNVVMSIARSSVAFILTTKLKKVWSLIRLWDSLSDHAIFFLITMSLAIIWVTLHPQRHRINIRTPQSRLLSVSLLVIMGAFTYPLLRSSIVSLPRGTAYTHPSYPLRILSAEHSVTGLIVVGEGQIIQHSDDGNDLSGFIRYLRASHSILGGVWIREESFGIDKQGSVLGDSIYSAFVLQEAARFINSTPKGQNDRWENVLIIGLGAGISASAFMKHNLSTTIVEIDPAVYTAARRFFDMPEPGPGRVFLQDARSWVEQRRMAKENDGSLFDIVVHDCFSGGGVPEHLFTLQFWQDLKSLIHEDGVLAVNYAGEIRSNSSQAILTTLENAFGPCRAFHDSLEDITIEMYDTKFVNLVFFCTLGAQPPTFRQGLAADHLGSPLRKHIFSSLPAHEIDLSNIRPTDKKRYILTDKVNPLGGWQERQASEHWRLMRDVLPDVFWETY